MKSRNLLLCSSLMAILSGMVACRTGVSELQTREIQVEGDGANLYVNIVGDPATADVLIAIHGGPGLCSHYMASLKQLTGKNLALVLYDQRGSCRSGEPTNGYGLLRYVEDLEAVRQAAGGGKVHLFGHSWGGVVAQRYATVYPEHIESIILLGSGPPDWQTLLSGQEHKTQRMIELQQQGFIPQTIVALEDILPSYYYDPAFEPPKELLALHYNPAVEQQTYATLEGYDFRDEVATLEHPVLILWGEGDPFGLPFGQVTVSALSHAAVQFVLLERCGHWWHECPDDVFAHIRTYLGLP